MIRPLFPLLLALLLTPKVWAADWEVAVLFLGQEEPELLQGDIDKNILELAQLTPSPQFSVSLYRELPERRIIYFPSPSSQFEYEWSPLFFTPPPLSVKISGDLTIEKIPARSKNILQSPELLSRFFHSAFRRPDSRRLVIAYAHGHAFDGMGKIALKDFGHSDLPTQLRLALPARTGKALDILWLDSCYMANLESAYQLRHLSDFLIASEDKEFSAGAPFASLSLIAEETDTSKASQILASSFIHSYSYTEKGSQRLSAISAPVVLSVVETSKLESLVLRLGAFRKKVGHLNDLQKKYLKAIHERLEIVDTQLVDIGTWFRAISGAPFQDADSEVEAVKALTDVKQVSNPQPLVVSVTHEGNSRGMMFGYHNWSKGDQSDELTLAKLPASLKKQLTFAPGPSQKRWPVRLFTKRFTFSPFAVDLNEFDYQLVDEKFLPVGESHRLERSADFVFLEGNLENPVRWLGYTEGTGEIAHRYHGLSVLNPLAGIPSVEYLDLDFSMATRWGNLR